MPIYEYQCLQCKDIQEFWQKITEKPVMVCPVCGGPLQKLVSLSSFKLKGGGWYADGYNGKPLNEPGPGKQNTSQISRNQALTENGMKAKSGAKRSPTNPVGA